MIVDEVLEWMWSLAGYTETPAKPEPPADNELHNGGYLPRVEVRALGFRPGRWVQVVHEHLSQQVREEHINVLFSAWRKHGDQINRHFAYILATVWHECKFEPGPERRASRIRQPRLWRLQQRYWPSGYYGRGYVQLTWRKNYARFSRMLGVDLVSDPDLANLPHISAAITVIGMTEGYFTGVNLSYYLDDTEPDWVNARRTINGEDKAHEIAATAQHLYNQFNKLNL